jgi:hypothetical protein
MAAIGSTHSAINIFTRYGGWPETELYQTVAAVGMQLEEMRVFPQSVLQQSMWQSGESYSLEQFEAKAQIFSWNRLGTSKEVAPLSVEARFEVRRPFPLSLQMTFQVLHLEESECTVMTSPKKHKSFRGVDSDEGLGQVEEDKVNGWREREDREEGGVSKGFGIGTKQPDQT